MPYRAWFHVCPDSDGQSRTASPICDRCGQAKEADGWRLGMHESMGRYQSLYRLKPVGPHRGMADELFRDLTVDCEACGGRGVLDDPPSWSRCRACRGLGRLFTVPGDMVESLRARILEAFPDAGARAIPAFPKGTVIQDLARGEIISPYMEDEVGSGGPEEEARRAEMSPAYFETRFRPSRWIDDWPETFVIITAWATTGEEWPEERSRRADAELAEVLAARGVWMERVVGFSPETGHEEPGWAVELSFDEGCDLGLRFLQDAIFHVRGDRLSVSFCDERRLPVPLGSFRDRLEPVVRHATSLQTGPDGPWALLTTEGLSAALDRHLEPDASAGPWADRVWRPTEDLFLHEAMVEAIPDETARERAREDVEVDYILVEDVEPIVPGMRDRGWVVECEVTNSMVSGVWGLWAFTLGGRGYLCEIPDFGATDQRSPGIVGAWSEASEPEARRACVIAAWARLWDRIGLPPALGEWVHGEPDLLCAALLRVLETEKGRRYWGEATARVRHERLRDCSDRSLTAIGHIFELDMRAVLRVLGQVEDPVSGLLERLRAGELDEPERKAVAALFLACIMPKLRPLLERPEEPRDLGPVPQIVGRWRIGYGGDDGMIRRDTEEELELRPDGSFTWLPAPGWLSERGRWGVEMPEEDRPRLYFEARGRRFSNYLVLIRSEELGTHFHWQRSRADGVVFKDRILRGDWAGA